MKELLYHYKFFYKEELYDLLISRYRKGYRLIVKESFEMMSADEQADFISTLDPYDPAYAFFSTMNFAESV